MTRDVPLDLLVAPRGVVVMGVYPIRSATAGCSIPALVLIFVLSTLNFSVSSSKVSLIAGEMFALPSATLHGCL